MKPLLTLKHFLVIITFIVIASGLLLAQTATDTSTATSSPLFTTSTEAVGLSIGGETVPGTDISAGLALTTNIRLESHNIIASANNFTGYFGGARYNVDLSKVIAKTTLPANTFLPYVHAAIGVVRNTPAVGATVQHMGGFVGGGIDYDPTGKGKFTIMPIRFDYLNAPGFGKSPHGWMVSAGLSVALASK